MFCAGSRGVALTRQRIVQDFYCSPGDPAFYFHHGMLDRVWWIWQMQDPENRINAIPDSSGAMPHQHTLRRDNPGDAMVDLAWIAPPVKLSELNDQLGGNGGQICYIYV